MFAQSTGKYKAMPPSHLSHGYCHRMAYTAAATALKPIFRLRLSLVELVLRPLVL